ncbi:MAG: hypothetical protein KC917_13575 [Candidatus Omnitrophica bacterium]|nr:hypothetical protein [Candidatus Omnitrophota bacterium]
MKEKEFAIADKLADAIFDELTKMDENGAWKEVHEAMKRASSALPDNYSLSLEVALNVTDSEREESVTMLVDGYATAGDHSVYRAGGGAAEVRYVVNGEICVVPDDHCPHCWGDWMFKSEHRECPECGYELGKEVKFLLDSDQCPHCGEGKITRSNPKCSECGYEVDPNEVVWG